MANAFISYIRQDSEVVDKIVFALRAAGIDVWLDRERILPGQRWKTAIRKAIASGDFFVACFSQSYVQQSRTYMNDELLLAIDELRQRPTDRAWFIPVLLSEVQIPDRPIGGGESLRDLQWVDLHSSWNTGIRRIVEAITSSESKLGRLNVPLVQEVRRLTTHKGPICSVGTLPDSTLALTALDNHRLELWNFVSGHRVAYFIEDVIYPSIGGSWQTTMNVSPDGRFVALCRGEEECCVWDLHSGRPYVCNPHEHQTFAGAILNDGSTLVSLGDHYGRVSLFDFLEDKVISELEIEPGAGGILEGLVLMPDCRSLLFYSDSNAIGHFSLTDKKLLGHLVGHTGHVTCVDVERLGRYAISGSSDETARIWDVATRQCIAIFEAHDAAIQSVGFSAQRGLAVSLDESGQLRVWDASSAKCIIEVPSMLKDARWSNDGEHLLIADGQDLVVCRVDYPPHP